MNDLYVKQYPQDLSKFDFYGYIGEFFAEKQYKNELPYLYNNNNRCWRLYFNKKDMLIGFCYYQEKNKNTVHLGGLYVLKEYRKNGFGTIIIKDCINLFQDKTLQSTTNNPIVINMRKKQGFKEVSKKGSYITLKKEVSK